MSEGKCPDTRSAPSSLLTLSLQPLGFLLLHGPDFPSWDTDPLFSLPEVCPKSTAPPPIFAGQLQTTPHQEWRVMEATPTADGQHGLSQPWWDTEKPQPRGQQSYCGKYSRTEKNNSEKISKVSTSAHLRLSRSRNNLGSALSQATWEWHPKQKTPRGGW